MLAIILESNPTLVEGEDDVETLIDVMNLAVGAIELQQNDLTSSLRYITKCEIVLKDFVETRGV